MADIELIKRYVTRACSNYGIVMGKLYHHDFTDEEGNAVLNCGVNKEGGIGISPLLLELDTPFVLAVLAHELGHLAMGHPSSNHSNEFEADSQSIDIMEFWGIAPQVTLSIHEKFKSSSHSHPGSEDRLKNIKRAILARKNSSF